MYICTKCGTKLNTRGMRDRYVNATGGVLFVFIAWALALANILIGFAIFIFALYLISKSITNKPPKCNVCGGDTIPADSPAAKKLR